MRGLQRGVALGVVLVTSLGIAGQARAQEAPPGTFDAIITLCLELDELNRTTQRPGGPDNSPLTPQQQDILRRCTEIFLLSGDDHPSPLLPGSLVGVAREELAAMGSALTETAVSQLANVQGRVVQLHRGARGISVAGLSLDRPTGPSSTGVLLAGLGDPTSYLSADAAQDSEGGGGSDPFGERWGLFVSGHFATGDRDATTLEPGYDFDSHDVTLGVDRRVGRAGFFGLAAGFNAADSELDPSDLNPAAQDGTLDVEGTTFSFYAGTGLSDAWLLDGSVALTSNDFDSRTPLRYDVPALVINGVPQPAHPVSQIAVAETEGEELVASVGIGYDRAGGGFSFQPTLRLTYTDASIDGYVERFETGPGSQIDPNTGQPFGFGMALEVEDQDVESLISTLGATLAWNVSTGWGVLIPQLRVEWMHEFEDDPRAIVTRFAATPQSIVALFPDGELNLTVFTNEPDRDYFNVGAGFQAVLAGGTQLFLLAETVQDLDNVSSVGGTAGIRFAF